MNSSVDTRSEFVVLCFDGQCDCNKICARSYARYGQTSSPARESKNYACTAKSNTYKRTRARTHKYVERTYVIRVTAFVHACVCKCVCVFVCVTLCVRRGRVRSERRVSESEERSEVTLRGGTDRGSTMNSEVILININ